MTAELREAKAKAERRVQEAAAAAAATARNVQADVPPTQGEARRWLRSGRYSRKAVATPTPAESVKLAEEAAAEKERYDRLKDQLQTWCLGTALVCFGATVVFYSKVHPLLCMCKSLIRKQIMALAKELLNMQLHEAHQAQSTSK